MFALVLDALTLRHRLLAALLFSATLVTLAQFSFRFRALRHRGFPGFALYRSYFIIAFFLAYFNHSIVLKIRLPPSYPSANAGQFDLREL